MTPAERPYSIEIRAAIDAAYEAWQAADALRTHPGRVLAKAKARELAEAERALRDEAAKAFAALNGWRLTRGNFGPKTLAKGGVHGAYDDFLVPHSEAFDHPVHFRKLARPYRTAAIVGQPYSHATVEKARAIAAVGLELHAPPNINASWHNPGSTRFFVFTRPGTPVKFLPEQVSAAP